MPARIVLLIGCLAFITVCVEGWSIDDLFTEEETEEKTECSNYKRRPLKRISKDCSNCGIRNENYVQPAIIGGLLVKDKRSYPWMVAILKNNGDKDCGGALISDTFILTAAHCIAKFDETTSQRHDVLPHERKIGFLTSSDEVTIGPAIKKMIPHPGYLADRAFVHDIALIELAEKITCHPYRNTLCLPPSNYDLQTGTRLKIAGWGDTEETMITNEEQNELLHANVRVIEFSKCVPIFLSKNTKGLSYCVKGVAKEAPCFGDSGTSMFLRIKKKFFSAGVTSGGSPDCNLKDPVVYTSVPYHTGWITKVTGIKPTRV